MSQENNKILDNQTVIYVDFQARKTKQVVTNPSAEEIYALFAPRFGTEFTEWFVAQYKSLEA